ncbi:hypothetical protein KEM48_002350 [Puccinia striiformis f. sp. tritici PST-130]|nr:hypothetical protein KEM48_002350 [Puccinia striiformis f. sp. tritici PST-130]
MNGRKNKRYLPNKGVKHSTACTPAMRGGHTSRYAIELGYRILGFGSLTTDPLSKWLMFEFQCRRDMARVTFGADRRPKPAILVGVCAVRARRAPDVTQTHDAERRANAGSGTDGNSPLFSPTANSRLPNHALWLRGQHGVFRLKLASVKATLVPTVFQPTISVPDMLPLGSVSQTIQTPRPPNGSNERPEDDKIDMLSQRASTACPLSQC